MPIVLSGVKRSREDSPEKVLTRYKLKTLKMAKIARVSSQNHFSVLADEVIDPSVLEKEQAPKKTKVPPIIFTELHHAWGTEN